MDAIEQLKQDVREGRIGVERLLNVVVTQQRQLQSALQELTAARQRIEELEKKAGGATAKVDDPFSMRAEEKRQQARHKKKRHKRSRKGRRGRLTSADKLKLAQRTRADVLEEIDRWWQAGQSCFTKLLKKMKLQPRAESILDKVMPAPEG